MTFARTFWLLVIVSTNAGAGDLRFGDWIASFNGEYREAYSRNESESSVGVLCSTASQVCFAYLRSNSTCNEGDKQVALVNTESGAFPIEMSCAKIQFESGQEFINFLGDYGTMKNAILKNNDLGIALPLTSGQFKVVRFSLRGSNQAIEAAEKFPARSKYRDQVQ